MLSNITTAITGLGISIGACEGLDAFEKIIYEAGQLPAGHANDRAGMQNPSSRLQYAATAALRDAGFEPGQFRQARAVAFVAGGALPAELAGPGVQVIDLSAHPHALAEAVEQTARLFESGAAEVVLFAAQSSLADSFAAASASLSTTTPAMGFDREVHGWRMGEGAAAVVCMPLGLAESAGRRVYAAVRSLAAVKGRTENTGTLPVPPALADARACAQSALDQAGVSPDQVGYVEAFASGFDALDGVEIAGLVQAYRLAQPDQPTALGSVQANTGYLGAASGLAGLVRAALCLYHRMLPAVPGWTAPKLPALWRGASFYVPIESRPWFVRGDFAPGRLAGVSSIGLGGSLAHLILQETGRAAPRSNQAFQQGGFYLVPVTAEDLPSLLARLSELRQALAAAPDLPALTGEWYAQSQADAPFAAALLGHSADEMLREVDLALKSIPAAFEKGAEWQTPLGSCFVAQPAGQQGSVAFVYPGAFNSYPGVGKDLFRLFPWLYNQPVGRTLDLGHVIHERMLYPRSLTAPTKEEQAQREAQLLADPIAMLTSGTTLAILFTLIMEEAFKIRPAAAFGYSLGENSMLFASQVWQQGDAVAEALETSDLFHNRLAGPQNAIRSHWGLPLEAAGDEQQPLWSNYLLMAPVERVAEALSGETRVYITHVNTPRQVVIGGDPAACARVIAALRCSSIQAPFDYALHCEAMASEFGRLADLHNWPVESIPGVRLYTAAHYGPMILERDAVARQIAQMLTSPLDFPRLVRRVYEDGTRIFIEVGAGSNCARWIDESLRGQPHLAVSVNRRGTDDAASLIRTLARLFSHRVPMDLSPLYQSVMEKVSL